MAELIFIHGWGYDDQFWQPLIDELEEVICTSVDLGYFQQGDIEEHNIEASKPVFITHSLGALWALKHGLSNMEAMVVFNGFTDFTSFTPVEQLRIMKEGVRKKAAIQLKQFWRMSGYRPSSMPDYYHVARLSEGLEQLACWSWDEQALPEDVPLRFVATEDDKIVPLAASKRMWQKQDIHFENAGGHCLPRTNPSLCAAHIKAFLKTHNL